MVSQNKQRSKQIQNAVFSYHAINFDKDQDTVRSSSTIMNLFHITNFASEGTLKGIDCIRAREGKIKLSQNYQHRIN